MKRCSVFILTKASLAELAQDEALLSFAAGLIPMALTHRAASGDMSLTLAQALHQTDPQTGVLLTALLVLDAEIKAVVAGEARVFPLPAFLTYRTQLPLDRFPLNMVRLPPLNPDGHYLLDLTEDGACMAVRLDLNPRLKVAGHVRMAISSPTRPPTRLQAIEQWLDWQVLDEGLIRAAVTAGSAALSMPLTEAEQVKLVEIVKGVIIA